MTRASRFTRICAKRDCPELADVSGYCRAHTFKRAPRPDQDRAIKARSPWRWVYKSKRWQSVRRQVLFEQPTCAADGCFEFATEVDHIVALQDGGLPFERRNLQPLCHRHHSVKTMQEIRARS